MRIPDKDFLWWLAGFFEGEGSIYYLGQRKNCELCIVQKNPKILHEIRRQFNLGKVRRHSFSSGGWTFKWTVSRRPDVIAIAEIVLPHLRFKKTKVSRVLHSLKRDMVGYKDPPSMTRTEIQFIRKNWGRMSATEIARVIGRDPHSISARARRMRLKSPRKRGFYPPTMREVVLINLEKARTNRWKKHGISGSSCSTSCRARAHT